MPDVTTILVSFNTADLLSPCLDHLDVASRKLENEVVIVDNASADDSVAYIQKNYPQHRLIVNKKNVGFGRANNQALEFAHGRYILLLNTDAFVEPDSLDKTVAYMDAHPDCGVLGVRLVGRDGVMQPCARYFPTLLNLFLTRCRLTRLFPNARYVDDMKREHESIRECDWVVGCYYLVRREVIRDLGLFDPRFFLYYEEVDHCLTVKKAGWKVVFFPLTTVIHIGGESARTVGKITKQGAQLDALQIESEFIYFRKNHGLFYVLGSFSIHVLGELVSVLRNLLKGLRPLGFDLLFKRTQLMFSILIRTAFGKRPTR